MVLQVRTLIHIMQLQKIRKEDAVDSRSNVIVHDIVVVVIVVVFNIVRCLHLKTRQVPVHLWVAFQIGQTC
jgi:hypothetical protein